MISNLQDATFEAKDDELDPEFGGEQEAKGIGEDSDGNPYASDDHSNAADDASDGANSGTGAMVEMIHSKSSTVPTVTERWRVNQEEQ